MARKYNVVSDDYCFKEGMTKEEIIEKIVEMIETHEVGDVDTGFVTTLKEQNHNTGFKIWLGKTAEFNALKVKDVNTLYIKTDDTSARDVTNSLNQHYHDIQQLQENIQNIGEIDFKEVLSREAEIEDETGSVTVPIRFLDLTDCKFMLVQVGTTTGYGNLATIICSRNGDTEPYDKWQGNGVDLIFNSLTEYTRYIGLEFNLVDGGESTLTIRGALKADNVIEYHGMKVASIKAVY